MTIHQRLSKHFTLREAIFSQTAERESISNVPPEEYLPRLVNTAEQILEPPREHYGVAFSPSSWFRCIELEKVICRKTIERLKRKYPGKPSVVEAYLQRKQHPQAYAVDFEVPGVDNLELAYWMVEHTEFDQLILEFYDSAEGPNSGWVHGSYVSPELNRREILTYYKRDGQAQLGLPPLP